MAATSYLNGLVLTIIQTPKKKPKKKRPTRGRPAKEKGAGRREAKPRRVETLATLKKALIARWEENAVRKREKAERKLARQARREARKEARRIRQEEFLLNLHLLQEEMNQTAKELERLIAAGKARIAEIQERRLLRALRKEEKKHRKKISAWLVPWK